MKPSDYLRLCPQAMINLHLIFDGSDYPKHNYRLVLAFQHGEPLSFAEEACVDAFLRLGESILIKITGGFDD